MSEKPGGKLLLMALLGFLFGSLSGCEATQKAKQERAKAEMEQLVDHYKVLARLFDELPPLETLTEKPCEDQRLWRSCPTPTSERRRGEALRALG